MGIISLIRDWFYAQRNRRKIRRILAYNRAHPLEEYVPEPSGPLPPSNVTDINKFREI